MTPNPNNPPLPRRRQLTLAQRLTLKPEEIAQRQLRRRLLRYIVATHQRRLADRRRNLNQTLLANDR